jgi:Spy/CpxP family protein refolding chaperone
MKELNLTEEQTTRINALRNTHLKEIKPLQDTLFSKGGDLRLLWLETDPDRDKIMALQKEIRTLRDQMQDKNTSHRLAILKILTPEQRNKLVGSGWGAGVGPGPRQGGR